MEEVATPLIGVAPADGPRTVANRSERNVTVYSTRSCSTKGSVRRREIRRTGMLLYDPRFLYFIENPALRIIKIGVAQDVEARRESLERACGVPLRVLAVVPEGAGFEAHLLAAFDSSRLLGEWFRPTPELLELIANPTSIIEFLAYAEDANRQNRGAPLRRILVAVALAAEPRSWA